jgi:hypothetical protein
MASSQKLSQLLSSMRPELQPGIYVYCAWPADQAWPGPLPLASFHEKEALTLVLTEQQAIEHQLDIFFRVRWISLTLVSELDAVGLTAAFATALTEAGVSCNVFAGLYHDHILVPLEQAEAAMKALELLQQSQIVDH